MKITLTTFLTVLLTTITAVFFLSSCDNPLALGSKLDLAGPEVEITAPVPRKAVGSQFDLQGLVSDRSSIDRLLVTASLDNEAYAKQWRYSRRLGWQVSVDHGLNWEAFTGAVWDGNEMSAAWSIPIDMYVSGVPAVDGEYLFIVQAWDSGEMSDDNSLRTIVVIYDIDPPKVQVFNPYLYTRYAKYNSGSDNFTGSSSDDLTELNELHGLITWKEPKYLGKFLTQEFPLQWQIEDQHDVWSIDLRFYDATDPLTVIDNDPETPLPDNYLYMYHEDPVGTIKPNDSILVPPLNGPAGDYSGRFAGTIKTPIKDQKTPIQVVAICYDAAGHVNQEKTIGYFFYWPEAAAPWITYSAGMEGPDYYSSMSEGQFKSDAFFVYPGRSIRANAYQAQGVSRVEYTIHPFIYESSTWTVGEAMSLSYMEGVELLSDTKAVTRNPARPNGSFSTIFSWSFMPEARSDRYVVKAVPYDFNGTPGEEYAGAFRVEDISFPKILQPVYPLANEPLFKSIGRTNGDSNYTTNAPANSIRISGIIDDATRIESLYMVWINPNSLNYADMSQLEYFRDDQYAGWTQAIAHTGANWPISEGEMDAVNPNLIWKVPVTQLPDKDPTTGRIRFRYDQVISLDTLGITASNQNLKNQVFLLRAENPDEKTHIITYTPQGDTVGPRITITNVTIGGTAYAAGSSQQIPQFTGTETITINGTWIEDSTEFLDSRTYFYNNMVFSLNGKELYRNSAAGSGVTATINPAAATAATNGTFSIAVNVRTTGTLIQPSDLLDTMVVNASVSDFGGNVASNAASWLIESDTLKFMRIHSEDPNRAYRQGDEIRIFIEFNKQVALSRGTGNWPVLLLNVTGGTRAERAASYDQTQPIESTKHVFIYKVLGGQNTPAGVNLNVEGISIDNGANALAANSNAWSAANYPFTFVHTSIDGSQEEIRLTMNTGHNGGEQTSMSTANKKVFTRRVPVTTNQNDSDYNDTLISGKNITVDNAPPTITGITASPAGWHSVGVDLYITATFSETVKLGTTLPQLTLYNLNGGASNRQTIANAGDIVVNDNRITFRYTVQTSDTTSGSQLVVSGFSGDILDTPGNSMTTFGANRTLTGVYIDTIAPTTPTVTIHTGTPPTAANRIGTSASGAANLGNLYHDNLYIQVAGATGNQNYGRVEYSLNNGTNWTTATAATSSFLVPNNGVSEILARQTDQAGNTSSTSDLVQFNWDKGALLTRTTSTSANGIYTHRSGRNTINVTVEFRKPLTFTGTPTITLNARRSGSAITVPYATASPSGSSLSFTYTVQNNDSIPNGAKLDVTGIGGYTAVTDADTVNVANYINNAAVTALTGAARLNGNKDITVETGSLTTGTLAFVGGDGVQADGSYWTTLEIPFNHTISQGSGTITIEQSSTNYRLPAVLTEAQYNRFRGVSGFADYYTRGTNGFNYNTSVANSASDISVKYVLNYQWNPDSAVTTDDSAFTGDKSIPDAFFTAFRAAETIKINVNSQAVTIDGSKLIVTLTGTNALQVPGATYLVSYPDTLVTDSLDNTCTAANQVSVTPSGGIARPFVRIKKTQDIISTQNGTANNPRLVAAQPFLAYARMDTRTPGADIYYNTGTSTTDVTAVNWGSGTGTNGTGTDNGGNGKNGPDDTDAITITARPTQPTSTSTAYPATSGNNRGQITIGTADTYQGYQWWVRARARIGPTGSGVYSDDSDEVAYRTVITYIVRGNNGDTMAAATGRNIPGNGDQIWIRGGDAILSSSVPGLPFTWEDNFDNLAADGKRAGIRLMTKTSNTALVTNAIWKFVTWDINTTVYIDFILGRDTASSADYAWQYGPAQVAYQADGWTAFKVKYPIYPGKHRWCDVGQNISGKGTINYSGTFIPRPTGLSVMTDANSN